MTSTQAHQTDWRVRPTVSVEEAGEIVGVGRSAAYEAARTGDIPTLKIGRRLLVPVARLRAMLGEDPTRDAPAANQGVSEDSSRVRGQAPVPSA